jgi:hypothetical protein
MKVKVGEANILWPRTKEARGNKKEGRAWWVEWLARGPFHKTPQVVMVLHTRDVCEDGWKEIAWLVVK